MRKLYWIIGFVVLFFLARFLFTDVYRWEENIRSKADKDWVLLRENRKPRLFRPWEWFDTPATGLHYLMAVRTFGENEVVIKYKIFNYTDPVTDTEEDHERYGKPKILYSLIDLANKREYFLHDERAFKFSREALMREAKEHEGFKIGEERCLEVRSAISEFERVHRKP